MGTLQVMACKDKEGKLPEQSKGSWQGRGTCGKTLCPIPHGESHYRSVKPLSIAIHGMNPKLLAMPMQAHPSAIRHATLGEMVEG